MGQPLHHVLPHVEMLSSMLGFMYSNKSKTRTDEVSVWPTICVFSHMQVVVDIPEASLTQFLAISNVHLQH